MDIKLKNHKASIFIVVLLTISTLVLSCTSSSLEGTVFNKIVHSREYIFDISDIEEYPKLKREKGTKKLIYTVDFSEFVKYDLPKAGDKLTLKYKGFPNKEVPGSINVSLAAVPGQTESYIFASNLEKKQIFESQVSFILNQDIDEVKFSLKYDNPKEYFSLVLELEKVADTTDTKAEKKALERAIKNRQEIVEIATFNNGMTAVSTPDTPVVENEVNEKNEELTEELTYSETNVNETQTSQGSSSEAAQGIFRVPKRKVPITDIRERPYYKLSHPRLYYFDINKIDQYPKLKKEKDSEKLVYSVDFTKLAKDDMPQAGDKIIFINQGYSNKDIPGNIYASLETPSAEKVVFSTDLKKKETFRNRVSFVLQEDLDKVQLNLEYDNPNDYSSAIISLEQAIFSTDTKEEMNAYKKALRQGREIIQWTNEIVDDNKDESTTEPDIVQEQVEVAPIIEEKQEPETPIVETKEEQVEETIEEPDLPVVPIITEQPPVVVPVPVIGETEIQEHVVNEKTPEELLMEERKKLEEQQRKLKEEQEKLEAEKAKFAAEEKARQEAEAARLAKEAEEKAKQQEIAKQEEERLKQQQMLEETIEAVTNTNVKRYEKEYLNDYAVSGYTFDMEQEQQNDTQIFENPNEINKFGKTLLMDAAKDGNDWKIKALLTSGADVNLKDKDGWTALMYAVRYNGNMNCVDLLIEAGADVKAVNKYGTSALVLAANYNSNPEILKKLLNYYSPNEKDVLTSFIQVLTENQDDEYMQIIKVNMFLDMSVPLNSLYNGKTPLMYAAESGSSTKVIKMLMENSNIDIRSREGKTAFDYAKENPKLKHDDIYWSLNSK